ncbi:glycosyl transferase family 2 [filamentous cyanobacterium CCP5]|nr:glycosyl transferase family 2 [filamentous cyanobacterium CCP5]
MITVGLIGTGFVARLRSQAITTSDRAQLTAVASRTLESAAAFASEFGGTALPSWQAIVEHPDIDLVIITHVNSEHGDVAAAALQAGKHVVVEYPLSLDVAQAKRLVTFAQERQLLLHVEHIELLGGLHRTAQAHLDRIGRPHYVRYSTVSPKQPAPEKWTYEPALFGFSLVGALSRVHRLTNLLGPMRHLTCQARYDGQEIAGFTGRYRTGMCLAQMQFESGVLAETVYGKGEGLWQGSRSLEIHGDRGALIFEGDRGTLVSTDGEEPIEVAGRRGLFAEDTRRVLDYLTEGSPLYVDVRDSLYALEVADLARQSAIAGGDRLSMGLR